MGLGELDKLLLVVGADLADSPMDFAVLMRDSVGRSRGLFGAELGDVEMLLVTRRRRGTDSIGVEVPVGVDTPLGMGIGDDGCDEADDNGEIGFPGLSGTSCGAGELVASSRPSPLLPLFLFGSGEQTELSESG